MVNDDSTPIDLELLKKAIDASNDGIVIAEREGDDNILIYANRAFEQLTGYQQDEILFQDCRFLQAGDRDQQGLAEIKEALANNQPCRVVLRNYRKDGSQFWNELSISPVFNEQDQLMYYIGVQKDVTRQVEAEKRALRAEAELAELRAKTGL
ncbi:PAS domain-containing protein [Bacterioplanoides pacificum]|uniref:PAS domain-containing protein n=1 Tax=Bacterioplanoides pacificum TaxID=1171596 RepID=A0ABV7VPJ4_9GAMM